MLKADDNDDHRNVQQPVNERNVNLPGLHFRGMDNAHRRQIAQTHCLTGQGEDPGNHCLGGDNRRQRGDNQHRDQRPLRRQQEERVFNRFRVLQQQRALAKIVQHQRGQHDGEPGNADRQFAEVAHIGVQRFHPGNRQHHRAKRNKGNGLVLQEEVHSPVGVQRLQNFRISVNASRAQHRQQQEPDQHNRRKQLADHASPVLLDHKQQGEHDNGDRDNPGIQLRGDNF